MGFAGLHLNLPHHGEKTEVFIVALEAERPELLFQTDDIGQKRKFNEVEKKPEPELKPQQTPKKKTERQAPQEHIVETVKKSTPELKPQNTLVERITGQQSTQGSIGEVSQKQEPGLQSKHTLEQTTGHQTTQGNIGEKVGVINSSKVATLSYQNIVRQRIEEAKKYPLWARKQGIEGIAYLYFTVLRNGNVSDIQIVHSSDSNILDEEAVATVKRAQPFPPVPKEINGSSLGMQVAIVFSLKKN